MHITSIFVIFACLPHTSHLLLLLVWHAPLGVRSAKYGVVMKTLGLVGWTFPW